MEYSLEEVELAGYLTDKAFVEKKNIARERKLEFLLWLSGKRDIRSAIEATKGITVEITGGKITIRPEPKMKKADPLALERISLSRV
jgi:hypothetical protein